MTDQDISLDEPFTIYHAQFPVATIIEQLKNYNNPPLYEVLLHFWMKAFGISPFSVRLMPMLFASFSPVALYFMAKKNFSVHVAISSSLLLSFSNLLMFYAQDCRVYSLFLLLGILSMHFYLNTVRAERQTATDVGLFITSSVLLMYAHYFGVFILFFQGLHLLFFHFKKLKNFLFYYLLILFLYGPHIYAMATRLGDSVSNGTWLKPPSGVESLYNMLWTFSNYPIITVGCIALLITALARYFVLGSVSSHTNLVFLMLIWFLIPFLGMFFISYWIPMYIGRYLIFALPAYYILLAICIEFLFKKPLFQYGVSGFLILGFLITLDYNPDKKQPVLKMVTVIKEFKTPETLVLVYPRDFLPSFAYSYNRAFFSTINDNVEYSLTDSLLQTQNIFHVQNAEQLVNVLKIPCKEILFFGQGDQRNSEQDPVFKNVSMAGEFQWKKQVGPGWFISSFKSTHSN